MGVTTLEQRLRLRLPWPGLACLHPSPRRVCTSEKHRLLIFDSQFPSCFSREIPGTKSTSFLIHPHATAHSITGLEICPFSNPFLRTDASSSITTD